MLGLTSVLTPVTVNTGALSGGVGRREEPKTACLQTREGPRRGRRGFSAEVRTLRCWLEASCKSKCFLPPPDHFLAVAPTAATRPPHPGAGADETERRGRGRSGARYRVLGCVPPPPGPAGPAAALRAQTDGAGCEVKGTPGPSPRSWSPHP